MGVGMSSESQGTQSAGIRFPAVSLTYDGTDLSHLETVVPHLEEFGLRGTFYARSETLLDDPAAWQAVANEGHEIGSGTLFGATDPRGNLFNWTLEMVEDELRASRKLLAELFPRQSDCSFAYPGDESGCMSVPYHPEPTSYRQVVDKLFQVARSAVGGFNAPSDCALGYLFSAETEGGSAEELVEQAKQGVDVGCWAILAFRGVGSGDGSVDASAHRALCGWLAAHSDEIATDTTFRIAMRIRSLREAPSHGVYLRNV